MPVLSQGNLSLNFGIMRLTGSLSELDRQCAWKLYAEIVTRVAVSGKRRDKTCLDFEGEIIYESFASLYQFFQEAREIMKEFPVGRIENTKQSHLGNLINDLLAEILRPFLEKWQADFRTWWMKQNKDQFSWFELQRQYNYYDQLISDWCDVRLLMRQLERQLLQEYKLQPLN